MLNASIKWLQINREPWEMVEEHWKTTFNARLNDIRNNRDKLLSEFFEKMADFKSPNGLALNSRGF